MTENETENPDRLYAKEIEKVQDFAFNAAVTNVFDDMVRRSVPGYETVVDLVGIMAAAHQQSTQRPLRCLDLGCSRGAVTKSILNHLGDRPAKIYALDQSKSMI